LLFADGGEWCLLTSRDPNPAKCYGDQPPQLPPRPGAYAAGDTTTVEISCEVERLLMRPGQLHPCSGHWL